MTVDELEAAYQKAMYGGNPPNLVLLPEGAIVSTGYSTVIYDYDADGNFYKLSEEEQRRRFEAIRDRLGKVNPDDH
jgi:hypothetical protein